MEHDDQHEPAWDLATVEARLKAFDAEFSIKSYLELREDYPGLHIPIRRLGGFDSIRPLADRLKAFGVQELTVAGVMDADHDCIEEVALILLRELDRERDLAGAGLSQLQSRGMTPATSTCFAFVCICFESMEWADNPQNISALHFLLQQLLLPGKPDLKVELDRDHFRWTVVLNAALICFERGKPPSFREMAKRLGRAPTTISRLFDNPDAFAQEVVREVEMFEHFFPGRLASLLADLKQRQAEWKAARKQPE